MFEAGRFWKKDGKDEGTSNAGNPANDDVHEMIYTFEKKDSEAHCQFRPKAQKDGPKQKVSANS